MANRPSQRKRRQLRAQRIAAARRRERLKREGVIPRDGRKPFGPVTVTRVNPPDTPHVVG